ncbi:MAG: hypothetical protein GX893_03045 [Firmicutes bacterium]|nr:hypothetical protein [Bacillota bacterium]
MDDYKQNLQRLLQNVDSDNLIDKINQLSLILGDPQQARQVENTLKGLLLQQNNSPKANLLIALMPFLSDRQKVKAEKYLKILNTAELINTLRQKE